MRIQFAFFLFLPFLSWAQLIGKVVSIADGATFTMVVDNEQIRIRLHGIDCPEKGQDFRMWPESFSPVMSLARP